MNRIVVISDLHIGAGVTDDCDKELESGLISFLSALSNDTSIVELVINGDFLDFAQAEPWQGKDLESISKTGIELCFTEDQSCQKLEAIAKAHKPIFEALRNFVLSKSDNKIVILPGNHDADFFWDKVRLLFLDKVCDQNLSVRHKIYFHLEQVYHPIQCSAAWIEHGNQYDPTNSFFVREIDISTGQYGEPRLYWSANNPPIFDDVNGKKRLYECIGTRFLIQYINKLDAEYPFVDNVKPFSRFLKIFGASAMVVGYGPIKATASVWGMLNFLAERLMKKPGELLSIKNINQAGVSAILSDLLDKLTDDEKAMMKKRLEAEGVKIKSSLSMYIKDPQHSKENAEKIMDSLSKNLDIVGDFASPSASLLSLSGGAGTLSLAKGFSVDETEELKKTAKKIIINNKVSAVVMGHTHESVNEPNYVNTGSWTRYYKFSDDESTKSWKLLKTNSYESFPYALNYAEIIPESADILKLKQYIEKNS